MIRYLTVFLMHNYFPFLLKVILVANMHCIISLATRGNWVFNGKMSVEDLFEYVTL
jgi:hypothetical protein